MPKRLVVCCDGTWNLPDEARHGVAAPTNVAKVTVGALGIPAKLPGWEWLSEHLHGWKQQWGFHDTRLSSHVKFAHQALAIDEEREPFQPTLWGEDDSVHGQTLEQVWFAGVHTEAGGGSKDPSLSDIALLSMVQKAKACGLVFEPGQLEPGGQSGAGEVVAPNYAAPIVDSRKGVYAVLHPYHRLTHADVAAPGQSA